MKKSKPVKTDRPRPPAHLSKAAKDWWEALTEEFVFDSPDSVLRLTAILEAFDRMAGARETLAVEGVIVKDRFGFPKMHPLVLVERDARAAMMRGLRDLGLDIVPPGKVGRPPGS